MYEPENKPVETLESCIAENEKKSKRVTRYVTGTLALLVVVVGAWLVFGRPSLGSEEVIAIMSSASMMAALLILPNSSRGSCDGCWLKKILKRKNQPLASQDESLSNTNA